MTDNDCLDCGVCESCIERSMHYFEDAQGAEDQPCCLSCGVPFVDHLGIIGTCAELLKTRQENVKLHSALGGLIGYASSVDVDNVPWVKGLTLRINRAMEAMGTEGRYAVVGGKIVKAGDE